MRSRWLAVGGLTLLAAALRFPLLSTQGFWVDELFTRQIVLQHGVDAIWHQIHATESTPPLYYLLAKLTADVVGNAGPFALRFVPALALTAAVPVAFLTFCHLMSEWAAVAGAAVVAVDPVLVNYATDGRAYGLLVLCGLLSIWACLVAREDPSPARLGAWAVAGAAAIWTHWFAGFLVLGEALVLLAGLPGPDRRRGVVALFGIGVLCGGLVPLLIAQSGNGANAFIAGLSLGGRVADTVREFGMGPNVPRAWLEVVGLLVVYGAALAGVAVSFRESGTRIVLWLGAAAVGLPLVLGVLGIEDRFYMRNVLIGVPLLAALAGPGLVRWRGLPLLLVLVIAIPTGLWVATDWRYGQPDWRGAIAHIPVADLDQPVLAVEPGNFAGPPAAFYLHRSHARRPVVTDRLLLIVGPNRRAHGRALGPVPPPAELSATLAPFRGRRLLSYHGFVLTELTAGSAVALAAVQPANSVLLPR